MALAGSQETIASGECLLSTMELAIGALGLSDRPLLASAGIVIQDNFAAFTNLSQKSL